MTTQFPKTLIRLAALLSLTSGLSGCGSTEPDAMRGSPPHPAPPVTQPAIQPAAVPTLDEQLAAVARRVPSFGGMFIDETGQLTVYMLGADQQNGVAQQPAVPTVSTAAIEAAIAEVFGPERLSPSNPGLASSGPRVRVLPGQYSFLELKAWHDGMTAPVLSLPGVTLTDISESQNRLRIGLHDPAKRAQVEATLAKLGIPSAAVLLETVQPVRLELELRDRSRALVGGQQISDGEFLCTLGFNATRAGVRGFVTNSHCTTTMGGVENTPFFQPASSPENRIGVETADPNYFVGGSCPLGRRCRYSDSAFVALDGEVTGAQGFIAWTNVDDLKIIETYKFHIVGSAGHLLAGDVVHKVGRTTGRTEGKVTDTCVNLSPTGTNVTQLCQNRAAYASGSGDSGSPVFRITHTPNANDVLLAGIHWASGGAFSPMTNIQLGDELGPLDIMSHGPHWISGNHFYPMDVNGDGRDDMVIRFGDGGMEVRLSDGHSFAYSHSFATRFTDAEGWNTGNRFYPMDINGDGKKDMVIRYEDGGMEVRLSNGTSFDYSYSFATRFTDAEGWNTGNHFYPMDVNGDGKDDMVIRYGDGGMEVRLSNGTSFDYSHSFATRFTDAEGWNTGNRFYPMDIDGDGKDDMVIRFGNGGMEVRRFNGTSFDYSYGFITRFSDLEGWNTGNRFYPMDIDGDGRKDMVIRFPGGEMEVRPSDGRTFTPKYRFDTRFDD